MRFAGSYHVYDQAICNANSCLNLSSMYTSCLSACGDTPPHRCPARNPEGGGNPHATPLQQNPQCTRFDIRVYRGTYSAGGPSCIGRPGLCRTIPSHCSNKNGNEWVDVLVCLYIFLCLILIVTELPCKSEPLPNLRRLRGKVGFANKLDI